MTSPLQDHHIIPQQFFGTGEGVPHALIVELGNSFSMDSQSINLMGLPAVENGVFTQRSGPHKGYSAWIKGQLDDIHESVATTAQKRQLWLD